MDTTRSTYDVVAADYARLLPDASVEAPADRELIGRWGRAVAPGGRILDAGCGAGRMIGHLASLGHANVEGVDLSPGMIALARASFPAAGLTVADVAAMPFPDSCFDAGLAWYSIIHTAPGDLPAVLAGLHRVLRPEAPLLLGFHSGAGVRDIRSAYGHDVELTAHLHAVEDISRLLERQGFSIQETLQRPPAGHERAPQGFVWARRR